MLHALLRGDARLGRAERIENVDKKIAPFGGMEIADCVVLAHSVYTTKGVFVLSSP